MKASVLYPGEDKFTEYTKSHFPTNDTCLAPLICCSSFHFNKLKTSAGGVEVQKTG